MKLERNTREPAEGFESAGNQTLKRCKPHSAVLRRVASSTRPQRSQSRCLISLSRHATHPYFCSCSCDISVFERLVLVLVLVWIEISSLFHRSASRRLGAFVQFDRPSDRTSSGQPLERRETAFQLFKPWRVSAVACSVIVIATVMPCAFKDAVLERLQTTRCPCSEHNP
jgi:hypothetical protein